MTSPNDVWVFHRGALGDSILLWPMLRAITASGARITLITDDSKGRLAAAVLGVSWRSAESRWCTQLWRADHEPHAPVPGAASVRRVVAFLDTDSQRTWESNALRVFPRATISTVLARPDRALALEFAAIEGLRDEHGGVLHRWRPAAPAAPVVMHIGAGSEAKRWPLENFLMLESAINPAQLIAGEVEQERLTARDRSAFAAAGGRWINSLDELLEVVSPAAAFIGCDSGPTHLAAQLGVPTVAIFGPTDPTRWAPIGPAVSVVTPPRGAGPVADIEPETITAALHALTPTPLP